MEEVWIFSFIKKIYSNVLIQLPLKKGKKKIQLLDSTCRVTDCSPHLNRNGKWAQLAQYNKFVREWVKELGQQRFLQQLLGSGYLAEEAKTHEQVKILCPRSEVWTVLTGSDQIRGV